jgi:hypothetical protein
LHRRASGDFGVSFKQGAETFSARLAPLLAELRYRPFVSVFALALVVRVVVMLAYFPAVMLSFDSPRYARVDGKPLFSDYWMPAGYPLFLKSVHVLSDQLWVTVALQHVIGLSAGVIVFLVMRYLRASRPLACVAAAVPLLSGDHIYLEHMIMADFLFASLTTAGLAVAVIALAREPRTSLLAFAAGLLGIAALVRSVGLALLPVLLICAFVSARGRSADRLKITAAAVLPALLILVVYAGVRKTVRGKYLGFSDMAGWNVYSRVAPFADCAKFSPPEGTAVLCENAPPRERPGPFFYVWNPESISRRNFGIGPATQKPLGRFAVHVIEHQPFDYMRAVIIDLWRYIEPLTGLNWPYSGQTYGALAFGARDPGVEARVVEAMSRTYRGAQPRVHGEQLINTYQQLFRIPGLLLGLLLICATLGVFRASRPIRIAIALFGLGAAAMYVVPVATVSYDVRYGVPPTALLAMAGLLGAKALAFRLEIR